MSLFWLTYRRCGKLSGIVLVEASNLLHANLEGLDRDADFAEGHEFDDRSAALVLAG